MNGAANIEISAFSRNAAELRRLGAPRWCAVTVLLLSILVAVGWLLEIDFLKRIIPGYVFMNPATAAAFILSSAALWLLQSSDKRRAWIAQICAAVVLLIGLIKIFAITGFFDFGIDQILFKNQLFDAVTGQQNRMAPNAALNFFLFGAAVLLLNVKPKNRSFFTAQYPAIVVLLTSFLAIVGYLYGAKSFYVVVSFNPMAIHTAASFLLLAVGLLLSRPQFGLIKEMLSPQIGGQTVRRLFPLIILVPMILGWMRLYGEKQGLYTVEIGTAMLVVAIIIVFASIILGNARLINNAADKLGQTENALNNSGELIRLLSESEKSYRQLADAMPQIVWTARPDGFLDYYNQRWFDYTGMTLEQTKGWGWEPVLHPDDLQNCLDAWTKALETGEKYKIEYRFKRGGEAAYRWHLGQALPVRDAENRIVKWFGTCTDIHEQKKVEEELRQIQEELESRVKSRTAELERANFELKDEIAERKRTEEKLIQLSSIVESSNDAIVSKNLNGVILSWNKGAERLYGYTAEEVTGKNTSLLIPSGLEDEEPQIMERIRRGEIVAHFETVRLRKDGSLPDLSLTISPIKNAAGEVIGAAKIARDITERKRAETELKDFAARLERSNTELQDFAAVASHDLQEPLRKIQAFGDRLKAKCGDALNADGLDYLERMQNAAARMQTLIKDLLKFSRVESKAQPFVPVDLRRVAEEVLSDFELTIKTTNAVVEIGDLATIDADPMQMHQLIQNLIGNALKFHRADVSPIVKISGRMSQDSTAPKNDANGGTNRNAMYCLMVEDNGIGFEEKYADQIFKVFQRLHGRGEYEGNGIGLAVCRKIAERHGGKIIAESVPGEGATFIIELPTNHSKKN